MRNTIVQLVALALVAGGVVALTLKDKDVTVFVSLFSPILSALFVVNHLATQDRTLNQIQRNTNGVLTERIKDAVNEALDQRRPPE